MQALQFSKFTVNLGRFTHERDLRAPGQRYIPNGPEPALLALSGYIFSKKVRSCYLPIVRDFQRCVASFHFG